MNKDSILQTIELKRKELIELGKTNGLTTDKTVKCSQELDRLLNIYQLSSVNK